MCFSNNENLKIGLVTSYGNVKSEIQLKLVFIVVGLHMYLVNRAANQSDKKRHFNFFQKRGGG